MANETTEAKLGPLDFIAPRDAKSRRNATHYTACACGRRMERRSKQCAKCRAGEPSVVRVNGAVAEITLRDGSLAIVDATDADLVFGLVWSVQRGRRGRAGGVRAKRDGDSVLLHRLLMGCTKGQMVDHINGDVRDNRRANLRLCSYAENQMNRHVVVSASGYKGVTWHKGIGSWIAQIGHAGRLRHLGVFATAAEAGDAYDAEARQLFGEFARTNSEIRRGAA